MYVRPREWDILRALADLGGKARADELARKTGVKLTTLMSDAASLAEKGLVRIREEIKRRAKLTGEGLRYARLGLPERRLVKALEGSGGEADIRSLSAAADLSGEELKIGLGWARRKGWVEVRKGVLRLLAVPGETAEEKALRALSEGLKDLGELSRVLPVLEKRGLVEVVEEVHKVLEITEAGLKVLQLPRPEEEVSQLTPELIITGRWRSVRLKRFNLEAPGTPVFPGRMHPVQEVIKEVREIFLEMGFEEIRGPLVETAFWNFDALFTPQDHPAREMHDTFYLLEPSEGDLPDPRTVEAVARTHEDGWTTGSTGWGLSLIHI